jgi:hypothetical protein
MRVLADFHHHDLFESLQIVFRDRFGWELARPVGMEWYEQEYWNLERVWHGDAVARQYLGLAGDDRDLGDRWERDDRSHIGRTFTMLTVEQARAWQPDIVIASVAHNQEGLTRFGREVGAKVVFHQGNVRLDPHEDRWELADAAILTTTTKYPTPIPHVTVRQEFSLDDFRYEPPPRGERLAASSFVQCLAETGWAYEMLLNVIRAAPEVDWRVYGSYGSIPPDQYAAGNLNVCADIGAAMRASDVAVHVKRWGDGFGHVIHNWFAVGRPVWGTADSYADSLAAPLWVEGVTSFDLAARNTHENAALMRRFHEDEDFHLRACENAAARFREVVDFAADAEQIRRLLESVA